MSASEMHSGLRLMIQFYATRQYTQAMGQATTMYNSPTEMGALNAYEIAAFNAVVVASVQRGAVDHLGMPPLEIMQKLLTLLSNTFLFTANGRVYTCPWNNTIKRQWTCIYFILGNWRDDYDLFASWKRGVGRKISEMLDEMLLVGGLIEG